LASAANPKMASTYNSDKESGFDPAIGDAEQTLQDKAFPKAFGNKTIAFYDNLRRKPKTGLPINRA
jgi:hypothetical protein